MKFSFGTIALLVLVLAAVVGVAVYIFRFTRRTAHHLHLRTDTWPRRIAWIAISIGLTGLTLNLFSAGAIILLHFFVFSMLVDLAHIFVHKWVHGNLRVWDIIWKAAALPLTITALVMGLGYYNMQNVTQTNTTVTTKKAIRDEGYRVALIADLHFGVSINLAQLEEICDRIEREQIDLLVLVGDITDESTSKTDAEAAYAAFGQIETTLGTYFAYGNHDRQLYSTTPAFTPSELESMITASGITILDDRVLELTDDLTIIGREDSRGIRNQRASAEALLAETDPQDFLLVLDHQPREYEELARLGVDLSLSGHTHAGQFWPLNWILPLTNVHDCVYGAKKIGSFTGFVSSGIAGWKFPFKTSAPAEYVILDILPAVN
ncbi:MAG: metallophosphoesterase, partial [Clostridia bacterium]|nr:metallophosphoesterase [Clostridia bacterium]